MSLEEELSFDIRPALQGIGQIDDALQQVTETFKVGLADALMLLTPPPVVIDEVDASAVSAEIDDAVATAETDVEITGDAEGVTDAADSAIADVAGVVDVEADTSQLVDDIVAGVAEGSEAAPPVELSVSVDTTSATNATPDLSGASAALAGLAAGEVGALGAISATAGRVVGSVGAIAASFGGLVVAAVESAEALDAFQRVLGPLAPAIEHVDIAGLNSTLGEISLTLGSTDEGTRKAVVGIVALGRSAAASDEQLERTTDRIVGLATAAVATRPWLGELGDVTTQLTQGLARGGRAASKFGISLSSTAITARATEIALADGRGEVTQWDKVMAGAEIAASALGTTLDDTLAVGAASVALAFKSVRERFADAMESIGAPLVAPSLTIIEESLPAAQELAAVVGSLGEAILPGLAAALAPLGDLTRAAFDPISAAIADSEGSFTHLGSSVGLLLEALEPLIAAFGEGLAGALTAATPLIDAAADVIGLLAQVIEILPDQMLVAIGAFMGVTKALALASAAAALLGVNMAFVSGPIGIAIAVAGALAVAFGVFGDSTEDATADAKAMGQALYGTAATLTELARATDGAAAAFADYIENTADLGKETELIRSVLDSLGVSYEDLREALGGSDAEYDALTGRIREYVDAVDDTGVVSGAMIEELDQERAAMQALGEQQLDNLVSRGELTEAERDAVELANTATDGSVNYAAALDDVVTAQKAVTDQTVGTSARLGDQRQAWIDLAADVAAGEVALRDAAAVGEDFEVAQADVEAYIGAVQAGIDAFVEMAVSALPTSSDAFSAWASGIDQAWQEVKRASEAGEDVEEAVVRLDTALDPAALEADLLARAAAIAEFQTNLETIAGADGLDRVYALLAGQGPELGGALARTYSHAIETGNIALVEGMEGALTIFDAAGDSFATSVKGAAPGVTIAMGDLAVAALQAFDNTFDVAGTATREIEGARRSIESDTETGKAAGTLGEKITTAFGGELSPADAAVTAFEGVAGQITAMEVSLAETSTDLGHTVGMAFALALAGGITDFIWVVSAAATAAVNAAVVAAGAATPGAAPALAPTTTTTSSPPSVKSGPVVGQIVFNERVDPMHVAAQLGWKLT